MHSITYLNEGIIIYLTTKYSTYISYELVANYLKINKIVSKKEIVLGSVGLSPLRILTDIPVRKL